MIGALIDLIPWVREGPGWAIIVTLLAIAGAGSTLVWRDNAALKRFAALAIWIGILTILLLALRGRISDEPIALSALAEGKSSIIVGAGIALVGLLAWLLGGVAAISETRRQIVAPLIFILAASSFGAITASDLLVLMIWQVAIGGSVLGFVLLLRQPGEADAARALMMIEAICLIGTGVALAMLGTAPSASPGPGPAGIGIGVLLITLIGRLIGFTLALPLVARAKEPVLAAEVAVAGIAIPATLLTLVAVIERFDALLPQALNLILAISACVLMLLAAGFAIGVRGRGARIAAVAASLIGLAVLGACEGAKTSLLFVLLWFGPVPAFLAASSIAGRIDRGGAHITPQSLTPQVDAIALLLAVASLALIGLPPFAGFWARLLLIEAAWARADYAIIAVTLLSSLVLAFALSRRTFEHVPATAGIERRNRAPGIALPELLVLGVMSGLSIAGGLYPAPFLAMSDKAPTDGAIMQAELTEQR